MSLYRINLNAATSMRSTGVASSIINAAIAILIPTLYFFFQAEDGIRDPLPSAKWGERFGLKLPNVAVFDPDGHLPLNLQRTGLTEATYPFDELLAVDVIRDFIAFSL